MPSSANTMRPTAFGSATQAMTTSQASASSRGVRATRAPASTRGAHLSGVRFQTVRSWPFSSSFRAMRLPISPRPANPTFITPLSRLATGPLPLQPVEHHVVEAPGLLEVREVPRALDHDEPRAGDPPRHVIRFAAQRGHFPVADDDERRNPDL